MQIFCIILFGLVVSIQGKSLDRDLIESEINLTLELLKDGEDNLQYSASKQIILVLGNSGAGKSTLTQFIAGDLDRLIAVGKRGMKTAFQYQ